tara:strand:+ start:665 stop:958 length:294 start_codon:yes stop_codon:yes gene_type:complete
MFKNKHKYLLLIPTLLVVSCGGVTDQDITRACTKIGNSPQYSAASTFADEYYALEDKAGKRSSASSVVLNLKLQNIKLGAYTDGFQRSCEKTLKKDF